MTHIDDLSFPDMQKRSDALFICAIKTFKIKIVSKIFKILKSARTISLLNLPTPPYRLLY